MSPTATATPDGFSAAYIAGDLLEQLDAWPARNGGVAVRLIERDDGEQHDNIVLLTRPDAARLMAFLNRWFAGLPLLDRAEAAGGLDPEHVPGGRMLLMTRAAEANARDYPSIGRPVDVSVVDLLVAAE